MFLNRDVTQLHAHTTCKCDTCTTTRSRAQTHKERKIGVRVNVYTSLLLLIHVFPSVGILMYAAPFIGGFNLDPRASRRQRRKGKWNERIPAESKLGCGLMMQWNVPLLVTAVLWIVVWLVRGWFNARESTIDVKWGLLSKCSFVWLVHE